MKLVEVVGRVWKMLGGVFRLTNAVVDPSTAYASGAFLFASGGDLYKLTSAGQLQSLGPSIAAVTWPSDANYTAVSASYSKRVIVLSGATLTATRDYVLPTVAGYLWTIFNNTGGAQSIVAKTAAGTGITIATGKTASVYCDGTNVLRSSADV